MNNKTKQYLTVCDFPEKFEIDNLKKLYVSYHFDKLTIKNVLYYSSYIGIERAKQRLFSIVFMRCMPQYILGEGVIEFDINSNRLTVYLLGYKPITFAQIAPTQPNK